MTAIADTEVAPKPARLAPRKRRTLIAEVKAYLHASPAFLWALALIVLPNIMLFLNSLWKNDFGTVTHTPTLENYHSLVESEVYRTLFWRTMVTAVSSSLIEYQWRPELGFGRPERCKPESPRHHAHDRIRLVVQAESLVDDLRITGKPAHPEVIAQHNHAMASLMALLGQECTTQQGPDTKHRQNIDAYMKRGDLFRFLFAREVRRPVLRCSHLREGLSRCLPVERIRR